MDMEEKCKGILIQKDGVSQTSLYGQGCVNIRAGFCGAVFDCILQDKYGEFRGLLKPLENFVKSSGGLSMREMFLQLSRLCADVPRPVVMMIDEVDSAAVISEGNGSLWSIWIIITRRKDIC